MAEQMKVRAQLKGDIAEIRVLMIHPMETGLRKDGAGNAVPIHYIQQYSVEVAGKVVIQGQGNQSVAKDPTFAFKTKGAKVGDKVVVSWIDNKGEKGSSETVIA